MPEPVSLDLSKPPPNRDYTQRPRPGPVFDVEVKLIGEDSNAFVLIGRVTRALKQAGYRKEADQFVRNAYSQKSYDDLLALIQSTVVVR